MLLILGVFATKVKAVRKYAKYKRVCCQENSPVGARSIAFYCIAFMFQQTVVKFRHYHHVSPHHAPSCVRIKSDVHLKSVKIMKFSLAY